MITLPGREEVTQKLGASESGVGASELAVRAWESAVGTRGPKSGVANLWSEHQSIRASELAVGLSQSAVRTQSKIKNQEFTKKKQKSQ